jgi:putative nucleotidyltransferase with HDIG domain
MPEDFVKKTKEFVKESFIKNPKFSFNDWTIMYNHHVMVLDLCLRISKNIDKSYDMIVLKIGALLHDIGKAYEADEKTLVEKHAFLGWEVSKDFLNSLKLKEEQLNKIKDIWNEKKINTEKQIIEDADTLIFYMDKKLNQVYKKWAIERKYKKGMQRKIDKFNSLHFEISKKIGKPLLEEFKKHWMKDI